MPVKSITALAEYQKLISSSKAVAVDFFATWCGPCRMVSPRFETMSEEYSNITFVKVDVDQGQEIAAHEQISAMPTFCFYKDGKKSATVVGADVAKIEAGIKALAA